jgi:hypothetical protein
MYQRILGHMISLRQRHPSPEPGFVLGHVTQTSSIPRYTATLFGKNFTRLYRADKYNDLLQRLGSRLRTDRSTKKSVGILLFPQ